MAGYIGSKTSVTQVDGYNRTEADAEFVSKDGDTITTAAGTALTLDRTGSEGTILDLKKDGSTVGSIGVASGEFYHGSAVGGDAFLRSGYSTIVPATSAGANRDNAINLGSSISRFKDLYLSGGVFADGREQLNLMNAKDMVVTDDYNSSTRANSVIYQNGAAINSASVYNGMTLYLSSYGLGGTHNDTTNERALQLYAGDTDEAGVYLRVKQGTNGWHRWKNLQNDWAALFGPSSYYGSYQSNWAAARGNGYSMSASTSTRGITINETGYYQCHAWNRSSGGDAMIGIAINGSRTALDGRTDGVWGHDHQDYGGSWTHSFYTGLLNAGEKITAGSPSNPGNFQYSSLGYAGALVITRLS